MTSAIPPRQGTKIEITSLSREPYINRPFPCSQPGTAPGGSPSLPPLGAAFSDGTEPAGCRGRGSNRPGEHLVSSIADRRVELQSRGAARAPVTTLIMSAVAIDVLIVRMSVSSQLLHYARSTAVCSRSQGGWATAECRYYRTNVFRMWVQQPLASQCPLLALSVRNRCPLSCRQ